MTENCNIAQHIVYSAFDIIKEKTGGDALDVFNTAVENVKPVLETKGRRVGGATYQVPMEIRPERRQTLAIRWIVMFARKRNSERNMDEKLAGELMDAYNQTGASIKNAMKCTEWLKLIRLLLTTNGNFISKFGNCRRFCKRFARVI